MSVGFAFSFGWLMMLLVSFSFTAGSHGERYICDLFAVEESKQHSDGLNFFEEIIANSSTKDVQM